MYRLIVVIALKIIPLTQGSYFAILSLLRHDLAPPPLLSSV